MNEKRFKVCIDSNNGVGLLDNSVKLLFIKFNNKEDAVSCKDSLKYQCNLMNELVDENEKLKQEIKQYWKCRDKWKQETKKLKEENEQLQQKLKEQEKLCDLKVKSVREIYDDKKTMYEL